MADQVETVELNLDDKELFQGALTDEPKQETAKEQPAEPERPRDEQGRFAPKVESDQPAKVETNAEVTPQADPKTKDDPEGNIPSWRLRELREARDAETKRAEDAIRRDAATQAEMREMRNRLAQFEKPKVEEVDFFQNPDEALKQRLSPWQEEQRQLNQTVLLNSSRALAIATHGIAAVNDLDTAIKTAMDKGDREVYRLRDEMLGSNDPVGLAMQWHKGRKLWETTGGDPEAYKQRILDEALKDPAYQAKVLEAARGTASTTTGNRPNIQIPPSLNRATGSGGSTPSADDDDVSDAALFKHATAPGRR